MRIVYLFVLILFTINTVYGQSAIKISSEKVKIGENVYYAHTVQQKETLYSLSKAYNVSQEEIIKHNQSAAGGLKKGTILYIPVLSGHDDMAKAEVKSNRKNDAKSNAKYRKHTVKWYEDITDISEKYGVTVEAIMALNNMKTSKLKTRQTLLIPDKDYAKEGYILPNGSLLSDSSTANPETTPVPTAVSDKDTTGIQPPAESSIPHFEDIFKVEPRKKDEPVKIAYILPLGSKGTGLNSNFMDFYAGSLLAINDMKECGAPISINVYDQSEYTPLHSLIDQPGFSDNQLLIGPARAKTLETFAGYSKNSRTMLVSPLDQGAEYLANDNPYFIQMPANTASQIENTINLLTTYKEHNNASKVLLIHEKNNASDSLYVNSAKRALDTKGIEYQTISYGILEGREIYTKILSGIDTTSDQPHIALVPSNSEAFVSDVLRNLDLCQKPGAKITVFGFPKWRNFETINVELYHKLNLHISLPYFVDYSNEEVKRFLLQYRALYATEPTPYAFQGYDITKYLLGLMVEYGKSAAYLSGTMYKSMLQSDFLLERESVAKESPATGETSANGEYPFAWSGLKNTATRNIVYNPDYTISVIKKNRVGKSYFAE